jgi:hypothetical protein
MVADPWGGLISTAAHRSSMDSIVPARLLIIRQRFGPFVSRGGTGGF